MRALFRYLGRKILLAVQGQIMWRRGRAWAGATAVLLMLMVAGLTGLSGTAAAQDIGVEPDFSIWDVPLGKPVTDIHDSAAAIIACGTNGGPISIELKS